MTTVREASFDLFRAHGLTTVFGNPGSTELPMLADWPDDFRYVLGLQEAVVVGMADGYAQATGRVAHVNLHTAPGVGNAVGALFNAWSNKAPLLVTAGQQVRAYMTLQANLTNRDAVVVPQPFVKWSYEPPRAADVPAALARAIHTASLPPRGPAFVSIPMDDWAAECEPFPARTVTAGGVPDVTELAAAIDAARVARAGRGPGGAGRLGRRGRAGRARADARVGDARAGRRAARLPGVAPAVPRPAGAGDRPGRADARRARPRDRRRLARVPVLPVHGRARRWPRGRGSWRSPTTRTRRRARPRGTRSCATSA